VIRAVFASCYAALIAVGIWLLASDAHVASPRWSAEERAILKGLALASLPTPPPDPSNRYADDARSAALGARLFADTRLSANGAVSCASCHRAELAFTDGLPTSVGVGQVARNAQTLLGVAQASFFFWDGRKDSLWSQALGPIEDAHEHGYTRMEAVRMLAQHYRDEYQALFGALPDLGDTQRFPLRASPLGDAVAQTAWQAMAPADRSAVSRVFAHLGKAIAAHVRGLKPAPAPFDAYVAALEHGAAPEGDARLSPEALAGLRLFIGPARCLQCHSGPLFTNLEFHTTGVGVSNLPEYGGRGAALAKLRADEFNCLGPYSDADPVRDCAALKYLPQDWNGLPGAFKTPTLRNLGQTAPYMRTGKLRTLKDVLTHYQKGLADAQPITQTELMPLNFSARELAELEAFLRTLDSVPGG
jgi:cytochrome c peroxidase